MLGVNQMKKEKTISDEIEFILSDKIEVESSRCYCEEICGGHDGYISGRYDAHDAIIALLKKNGFDPDQPLKPS